MLLGIIVEMIVMRRVIMSARTVIVSKQSSKLYELLVENDQIKNYDHLMNRPKLVKSWKIRATRAFRYLGRDYIDAEVDKFTIKKKLKQLTELEKSELTCIFYGRRTETTLPNQIWI